VDSAQTLGQLRERIEHCAQRFTALREEIGRVIVGQDDTVNAVLLALMAGGHVLLEGVPGLGKTLLVRSVAQALGLSFSRIQFTPDLMPADIVGTNVVTEDERGGRRFEFHRGPIFANVLLADEVNRATPKTQSALLEAMQEHQVTVGRSTHRLEGVFFVLATQNPLEMEGTYPLPEAQLDRFMFKVNVAFPDREDLVKILKRTTSEAAAPLAVVVSSSDLEAMCHLTREVVVAPHIAEFIADLVLATHPEATQAPDRVRRFVRYGSSPRGGQAIALTAKARALLNGRYNVSASDVESVIRPALRHRIILNFEGEAEGVVADALIVDILERVKEQRERALAGRES
jgi:MoxR-like ATPase